MKKAWILAMLLCLIAAFALTACGSTASTEPAPEPEPESAAEPVDESATEPAEAEPGEAPAPGLPVEMKDESVNVVAVFAQPGGQKLTMSNSEEILEAADTFYIFYSDNTFDQYAELAGQYRLFASGSYSFKDGGDFIVSEGTDTGIPLVLDLNKKHSPQEHIMIDCEESNEVTVGVLGLERLFGPEEEGKQVTAIFGDDRQLLHTDESGVIHHLDSIWIMFDDMSYKQYAYLDDEVVLYASGTYEFADAGDFYIIPFEDDGGTITLNVDYSYAAPAYSDDSGSAIFDLKSLGLQCYFIHKTDLIQPPQ